MVSSVTMLPAQTAQHQCRVKECLLLMKQFLQQTN
jgi:hypothetical protein